MDWVFWFAVVSGLASVAILVAGEIQVRRYIRESKRRCAALDAELAKPREGGHDGT